MRVCGHLVNNNPCPFQPCSLSHNPDDIRWWQQTLHSNSKKPCRKGRACGLLRAGMCLWFHTPEERAGTDRINEMNRGLDQRRREAVDIGSLAVLRDFNTITDDRELASFNRVADDEIAVPGSPPLFTPPTQALDVQSDFSNETLQLGSPGHAYAFEPLLRSVEVMQPTLDVLTSADVVSSANSLRKLFDVLSNGRRMEERFEVETRGDTLLLSKWDNDPSLTYSLGRGVGFERATCRYAPEDGVLHPNETHHRVVSYRFAGLRCVVQSQVDGYCCDCDHSSSSSPMTVVARHKKRNSTGSPSIRHAALQPQQPRPSGPSPSTTPFNFAALTLDDPGDSPTFTAANLPVPANPPPTPPPDSPRNSIIKIRHRGRLVPAGCLIELKTHNARARLLLDPEPQLYFSRRTKLYVASHKAGVFVPPPTHHHDRGGGGVQDKTADLRAWEAREQQTLARVAALLRVVRARAREMGRQGVERASLLCRADGGGRVEGVEVEMVERTEGRRSMPGF